MAAHEGFNGPRVVPCASRKDAEQLSQVWNDPFEFPHAKGIPLTRVVAVVEPRLRKNKKLPTVKDMQRLFAR